MDMEDVGVEATSTEHGESGVDDSLKALDAWSVDIDEVDTAIVGDAVVGGDVRLATNDRDIVAEGSDARE